MSTSPMLDFERLTRLTSKHFGVLYALVDLEGKLLGFDKTKATLLGLDLEQLETNPIQQTLLPSLAETGQGIQVEHFPRTEHYPSAMRSVLWEADIDEATQTALLHGTAVETLKETNNALELLTERVRRHDRLLSNLPGMAYRCRIDKSWSMEFVSEGAEPLCGYAKELLLSGEIKWGDIIVIKDREHVWSVANEAIKRNEPFTLYYQIETRQGEIKTVWERGVAVLNEVGEAIALEGFITDMTPLFKAQAQLRTSNSTLQGILDAATETAIVMTDQSGLITTFSRGAENMLGYKAEEMVHKQTQMAIHLPEEIAKRSVELTETLGEPITGFETFAALPRRGLHDRQDWTFVRKNGTTLPVELIITAVRDEEGQLVGFLGVAENVSERIQTQMELREAKDRAEASLRAKDEFLAVISHEMRTPLNPILGFSNMLLQENPKPEDRESLEIIQRSAQKLLRQIEDILGFIGIDKHKTKLELRPAPLWRFAQTMARDLQVLSASNQFQLVNGCELAPTAHRDLYVMMDHGLTGQIITNLVTNAFKFTTNGKVILRVGWRESPEGGVARFEVEDNGIGIAEEKHQAIFEPFTQVESNYTRRYEGVGLGLAICSKLLEVLGGRIDFDSVPGEGSTFWFEIPAKAVRIDDDTPAMDDFNESTFANTRILVAEDNPDNRKVLVNYLGKIGADVMTAPDGPTAVDRCRNHDFHFVLLDISMPGMDGFETARQILEQPGVAPKIIAVTAHASEDVRQRCESIGMVEFIPKPVTLDTLRAMLEEHQSVH